eukprot:scaffold213_cov245-Pinguiococcus_pyrenoidosus.AAC.28
MLAGVVALADVLQRHDAVPRRVQLLERQHHKIPASLVHLPPQARQKLVEGDVAVAVAIKVCHERREIPLRQLEAHIPQSVLQLRLAQLSIPIVVHDPQNSGNAADAVAAAPRDQELADFVDRLPVSQRRIRGHSARIPPSGGRLRPATLLTVPLPTSSSTGGSLHTRAFLRRDPSASPCSGIRKSSDEVRRESVSQMVASHLNFHHGMQVQRDGVGGSRLADQGREGLQHATDDFLHRTSRQSRILGEKCEVQLAGRLRLGDGLRRVPDAAVTHELGRHEKAWDELHVRDEAAKEIHEKVAAS